MQDATHFRKSHEPIQSLVHRPRRRRPSGIPQKRQGVDHGRALCRQRQPFTGGQKSPHGTIDRGQGQFAVYSGEISHRFTLTVDLETRILRNRIGGPHGL